MKPFIIILASFLFVSPGFAQNNEPFVYADIGMGKGTFISYKLGLNFFFNDRHSVGLYYNRHWRDGVAVPSDYHRSFALEIGNGIPNDRVSFWSATYGRVLPMTDISRFNLKVGAVGGYHYRPENFARVKPATGVLAPSANYNYDVTKRTLYGLLLNPVAEFTFSHGFGMSLGASCMFTNVQTFFSVDLTFIAGSLRKPVRSANYE